MDDDDDDDYSWDGASEYRFTPSKHTHFSTKDTVRKAESASRRKRFSLRGRLSRRHEHNDASMEDVHLFNPMTNKSDVIFGVYGADEWVINTNLRYSIENRRNTICVEGIWITPEKWDFAAWVQETARRFQAAPLRPAPDHREPRFNFMSPKRAFIFTSWGIIEAASTRSKLELEISGEVDEVKAFMKFMDGAWRRAENIIEWIYGSRGQSIELPLNYRPALANGYPWLPAPLPDYIDSYLDSQASVLILLGPPGTGKTTFIKNLLHRAEAGAKITYDEKVMGDDSLFAGFIESETRFLIMEDADAFLKARDEGNTMMHRFLNVSDGLISAQGKKMVFSTNLPNVNQIDPALVRPGRCFDIVQFRAYTPEEAELVAEEAGVTAPGGSVTLAQLFGQQPSASGRRMNKLGFHG